MMMVWDKAPISLAWRLVGDLLTTRVSVGRGEVAETSPGDLAVKSHVGLGDVAATKYVFEEEDVSATSPRRLRNVSETCSRPND